MIRYAVGALLLVAVAGPVADAQDWARTMFPVTEHDFGVVARGAKTQYEFELTNRYQEDVRIVGVRASCGCATPQITRNQLRSGETGSILITFNTRSFTGHHTATITVTIDRPRRAEVQLRVAGYIRSDVVFHPGAVQFGEVPQTRGAEQEVAVAYAGRSDWQIVDVRSANPYFEVELAEAQRSSGRVDYRMLVRLKPGTPPGYIHDQLVLVTDDQRMRTVPLTVEGRVVSPLTVSPGSLFLGVLAPGETVTKQLVVRGNSPFRVLDVRTDLDGFRFTADDEPKNLHLIPVTFTASDQPGNVAATIEIQTDLDDGAVADCIATATIRP